MRDGIQLICVTLDAPSDWNDQKAMMEYGFDVLENTQICKRGDFAQSVPVLSGSKDSISVSAKEDMWIIKEKSESATVKSINIPRYLIAPINEGDTIGNVFFEVGNRTYAVEIVANESVSAASRDNIFTKIKKIFR
jgi:D-alanyl-D-alanine carboxypeptidase